MRPLPRTMPALITPFDANGDLDEAAHRHNVSAIARRGGRGVVVGGSTGQGPYLEPGERNRLVSSARETAPDLTVICGVFAESVRQAVDQCIEAEDAGSDAVLIATPSTLVRARSDRFAPFFGAIADRVDVPILLYSVPKVTGVELSAAAVNDLATHPRIIGIKDSSGVAERFSEWVDTDPAFHRYCGASSVLAAAHRTGATGAITASSNYALADASLAIAGDRDAQRRLGSLAAIVEAHGVAGTMVAAEVTGLRSGTPRAPLERPDEATVTLIENAVSRYFA